MLDLTKKATRSCITVDALETNISVGIVLCHRLVSSFLKLFL